jgi:branched-chain amino acid aminotransferase
MNLLTGPLPPVDRIDFGKLFCPIFAVAEYSNGKWSPLRIEPLRALNLHPAAIVFHYGQSVFEGLKAFPRPGGKAALFRPELNARRFIASAERLVLPVVEEGLFIEAVRGAASSNLSFVPPYPGSLYLRPTLFGTEPCIGVRASHDAIFFVLAMPAGAYFSEAREGDATIKVFVNEKVARAARGGTGAVKASANYAVTLQSIAEAKSHGCAQVLYLDAAGVGVEEMGGMNIFFVIDRELVTPDLSGTILSGITRASIIEVAGELGMKVRERDISIREVLHASETGSLTEAFACGTAATIIGISDLVFEERPSVSLPDPKPGPMTRKLFEYIQGVQFGTVADAHGWTSVISAAG